MKNHGFDSCKICGGKTEKKYRISWNGIGHDIHKCEKCDFHFLDYLDDTSCPVKAPENISEDEFKYIEKLLQSNEERFHWQSELVCSYVGSQSPRVLDIGAGGGKFLASMRERGAVAVGIEPNGVRVRFARDRYQLEIDQRLIDDDYWQQDHSASFQAVSLWDVVEHVNDPKKLLEDAVNMLSPGGYLFIDTPTRESFYYRLGELSYGLSGGRQPLFLRSMYSPAPYAHKQIFTQKQLTVLLEGVGMNVRRLESFHELSFPYRFYLRKLVKSRRLADMLAPLASAFFVVFRIRNKMLVVARKHEPGAKSERL